MTTTLKPEESQEITTQVTLPQSTPPTSLLDVFLSTQVLNTRAVDPTLASLHEKMKEEYKQKNPSKIRRRKKDLKSSDSV